ncbi:MAG: response regulator [Deltaproteobacteria bacterium]|nr:response regulator [Deltaproteobacteria bacterium]
MTRVLVVEDSATQAEELRLVLEEAGFGVEVARDGQEGYERALAESFDLVVSDILMPRLSGYELCARLRQHHTLRTLPVLLLTSLSDPLDVIRGLESGADNFVTKPYEPDYLIARIRTILANRRIREGRPAGLGLEVMFLDRTFTITSGREQVLDLLLSTFEEILRANGRLQAKQAELQMVLDCIGEGVVVVDEAGRVVLANPEVARLLDGAPLGASRADWRERNEVLDPATLEPFPVEQLPLSLALRGLPCDDVELLIRNRLWPQGLFLSLSSRPLRDAQGAFRGGVMALRDVTERKRAAQSLALHAEALEKANVELGLARTRAEEESRFKSKFLANMSHELRTPLNSVIGFSELLEQELAGPMTPKQLEYIRNVLQSGKHLLNLVSDILDLSKIEAGRINLVQEWTHVGLLAEGVLEAVQPLAVKQQVRLEASLSEELPKVHVDPVRFKQVLYNLLSNGIKFTPPGGRVGLAMTAQDGLLKVAVTDTGIGIAAEDLPRLFKEFEQIEPSGGVKPEGTGLGLALVKRLVELHGGAVAVESEPGRGSTFSVTFPLCYPRSIP